jgi:hypothetical protein
MLRSNAALAAVGTATSVLSAWYRFSRSDCLRVLGYDLEAVTVRTWALLITTWRRTVPRVPGALPKSVVFIYPDEDAARKDERYGGTGFLVTVQGEEPVFHVTSGPYSHYIVTTAHVILKRERSVIRLNKSASYELLPVDRDNWIWQPQGDLARNDLAVLPFDLPLGEYAHSPVYVGNMIEDEGRVTEDHFYIHTFAGSSDHGTDGLGDDVVMDGRFAGHGGREINRPIARFGDVAMLPGEEIRTEDHRLRAFLVEMRSRGGHSGSPVFLIKDEFKAPPLRSLEEIQDAERWGRRWYPQSPTLLGIDHGQFPSLLDIVTEQGESLWLPNDKGIKQKVWVRERSALTIIIPSWHIVELLRDERLSEVRKRKITEERDQPPVH